MRAGLRLSGVSRSFGDTLVLDEVSFDLQGGELLVLLGPSGCGKSTLLRLIAGLEEVDRGTIEIDGRRVDKLPPKDRDVAMVFQNYSLYPHMTVRKNLAFPLKVAGVERSRIAEQVAATARLLDLSDQLDKRPAQLSGGQRQRVALGRAIIRKPSLFLLDEPLSNLDADLRRRMRREIVDLQRRLEVTTIHVTHDQTEALTMGDRIAVLEKGRLQQMGTPRELYEEPANLFVARFIGQPPINVIAWEASERLRRYLIERLPGLKSGAGDQLVIGIRPQDIRVDPDGSLAGEVVATEYHGHEAVLLVRLDGVDLSVTGETEAMASGELVKLSFDPFRALFFEPESGCRITSV